MPKRSSVGLVLPILAVAAMLGRCGADGRSQQVGSVPSTASNSAQIKTADVVAEATKPPTSGIAVARHRRLHTAPTERARSTASAPSDQIESPPIAQPKAPTPKQVARLKRQLIQQSIDEYDGSCPCPYNVARNGSSCGRRSAYSRPGGAAPLCYPGDVSDEMVAAAWQAETQQ